MARNIEASLHTTSTTIEAYRRRTPSDPAITRTIGSSAPSTSTKTTSPPDDAMPLFLSGRSEDIRGSARFGTGGDGNQERAVSGRGFSRPAFWRHRRRRSPSPLFSVGESARAVRQRQGFADRRIAGPAAAAPCKPSHPATRDPVRNWPARADSRLPSNSSAAGRAAADRRSGADARRNRGRAPRPPHQSQRCNPRHQPQSAGRRTLRSRPLRPRSPAAAAAGKTARSRRTRDAAEAGKGPARGRRHRAGAAAARTGGGRAGGERGAAAGADLRSGRARNAGHAQASRRIRRWRATGTRRRPSSARRMRSSASLKCKISSFRQQGITDATFTWRWRYSP